MEEWPKSFFELLDAVTEAVAEEVENFFLDVTEAIDVLATVSEQVANQVQDIITTEFDQFFNEQVASMLDAYLELEDIPFEGGWPITESMEPSATQNPACMGCRHYHGQMYGGNLLVCGMHPYGWDDENCPDWEGYGIR